MTETNSGQDGSAIPPADETNKDLSDYLMWLVADEYDVEAVQECENNQPVMVMPEGDPSAELISELRKYGEVIIWQSRSRHSRARALELAVELDEAGIPGEIGQVNGGTPLCQHLELGGSMEVTEGGIEFQRSWRGTGDSLFLREDALTAREWAQQLDAVNRAPVHAPELTAAPTTDTAPEAVTEARKDFDTLLERYLDEVRDLPGGKGSAYEGVRKDIRTRVGQRYADAQARRIFAQHESAKLLADDESDESAIEAVLSGDDGGIPTFGHIIGTDRGLFYEGSENEIFGSNSTGKSTILTALHAEVLNDGGTVVHWEFDNHGKRDHFRRLKNAGVDLRTLGGRFHLFNSIDHVGRSVENARLATLDALDPAIVAFGLDPNSPAGTDTVLLKCLRPYTLKGAVGVVLDHTGHENTHRAAGSKRKINAFQGAVYRIECETPLSVGREGVSHLILAKDNKAGAGIIDNGVATVRMTPEAITGGPGAVRVVFEQYDPSSFGGGIDPERQSDETQEERYARLLKAYGAVLPMSQRAAIDLLKKHNIGIDKNKIGGALSIMRNQDQ